MKNRSKYLVFVIIAIASFPAIIAGVYRDDYRRGGILGGGGFLGTGWGASRRGDYYSTEPGLLSRTGNTAADVAVGITGGRRYDRKSRWNRPYRRGYKYQGDDYYNGYGRRRSNSWF